MKSAWPWQPAQRPDVEQQKHEGKRDQHGLGHQAEAEWPKDRQVPAEAWPLGVTHIAVERQKEEECAKNVLTLRDPGYRFDVQREAQTGKRRMRLGHVHGW